MTIHLAGFSSLRESKSHGRAFLLVLVLFLSASQSAILAQISINHDKTTWYNYMVVGTLNPKWGYSVDGSYRVNDFFIGRIQQWMIRGEIAYTLADRVFLKGGYSYFQSYQNPDSSAIKENRPHIQLNWSYQYPKWVLYHRFRVDFRMYRPRDNGQEAWNEVRPRYQIGGRIPIIQNERHVLRWNQWHEFMLHFGSNILNAFDQYRFTNQLEWAPGKRTEWHIGYTWFWFQHPTREASYVSRQGIRLGMVWILNHQKKKS